MGSSDDLLSTAGGMSSEQIGDRLDELFREKAAVEGAIVVLLGEVERRRTHLRRPVAPDHDVAPVAALGVGRSQLTFVAVAATTERRSTSPSSEPSSAEVARSGCGMRPTTLPASLAMPAMASIDPFGLSL